MRTIRIYLKSGNYMDIECKGATFTKDSSSGAFTQYQIDEPKKVFSVLLSQIEAWQVIEG